MPVGDECESPDVEEYVGLFELHWQFVIILHGDGDGMTFGRGGDSAYFC